ncbi:IS5 family transposase [Rhizosaccharibacter radicis]|uniref:IS5 family transposase n=1 Tax=Rhizosaccharibacter radicis TaxID=2782605 RepID=A0ABT1VXT1_9PROT|nr:IS5 family transposase [Acetobacteraceae bacterium KSS12]
MSDHGRLSDEAWAVLEPHLPKNRPGAPRVDDRRVISGVLHVLCPGCRWEDCPPEDGAATTIYNRYNRWSTQVLWNKLFARLAAVWNIPDELQHRQHSFEKPPLRNRREDGEQAQASGHSRGGRTTRSHALATARGKPTAFGLTLGNVVDISVADTLLEDSAPPRCLLADKAWAADTPASRSRLSAPRW